MTEPRRLRTQAERDADGTTWRATANSRPGYATYPDTAPGSPCWWARAGEQPPARPQPAVRPWTGPDPMQAGRAAPFPPGGVVRGGVVPGEPAPVHTALDEAQAAVEQVLAATLPALGQALTELLAQPRRRWWHRYTRRTR